MAQFQILSDLHLENPRAYDLFEITPTAPYLALLGDIGNVKDDGYLQFLEAQLQRFKIVFLVLGNHEPFDASWPATRERLQQFSEEIDNRRQRAAATTTTTSSPRLGEFVLLDRTRYRLTPQVTVLGCTFHSRVSETQEETVSHALNDFHYIQDWTVEQHRAAHEAERAWLNDQVTDIARDDPHHRIVIFSHHSPTVAAAAVDPRYADSPITSAFATDLIGEPCWERPQVRLWAFGHTHYNCDFTDDRSGKRIVANQRGYYFAQSIKFDPGKVFCV